MEKEQQSRAPLLPKASALDARQAQYYAHSHTSSFIKSVLSWLEVALGARPGAARYLPASEANLAEVIKILYAFCR